MRLIRHTENLNAGCKFTLIWEENDDLPACFYSLATVTKFTKIIFTVKSKSGGLLRVFFTDADDGVRFSVPVTLLPLLCTLIQNSLYALNYLLVNKLWHGKRRDVISLKFGPSLSC